MSDPRAKRQEPCQWPEPQKSGKSYRKTLKGVINAPALFMWNVEKV